jgi:hypothetical protein
MGIIVSVRPHVQLHKYKQAQQVFCKVGITYSHIDIAHNLFNNIIPARQIT